MRVLILGASGRTGKYILEAALAKGYEVNCLVRNPKKFLAYQANAQVSIIEGTPASLDDLARAAEDCEYLVSALNISRRSDFPWARLRTPKHFLSEVMQNILKLAEAQKFQKITICSAWGVNETFKEIPWWFQLLIKYSNIGVAYRDHERQEALLDKTDYLNWTVVRPVGLINRGKMKELRLSFNNQPKPLLTVSRKEVGYFILDSLTQSEFDYKKPVLSSPLFS